MVIISPRFLQSLRRVGVASTRRSSRRGNTAVIGTVPASIIPPGTKSSNHLQLQLQQGRRSVATTITSSSSSSISNNEYDSICELAASNLRFGPGATSEVGQDLKEGMKAQRVIVVTDSTIYNIPTIIDVVLESLERSHIDYVIYKDVRVEPNDKSFRHAIEFVSRHKPYDAIVAVGGGSVLDTAKAANLYATFPPPENDFYAYVNPPLGKGVPVPSTTATGEGLPPLIAIPTTAGTGSETTGVAIFDDTPTQSKTGIASRVLKPTLGIIDPNNTKTLPQNVSAYSGLDVLCHAMESYTALPFNQRPKPKSPILRPAYQGSNPISDVWSLYALQTASQYLKRAVLHGPDDEEARSKMLMASAAAGMGFGNAGVHLCHGMSYPISSQVKSYHPEKGYDYEEEKDFHPMIPHGLSVIVTAPAVFRFTGISNPERHATCARILSESSSSTSTTTNMSGRNINDADAGMWLADEIKQLTFDLGGIVPMGLKTFGYTEDDIPNLVQGTLPQHRVTKLSPRPVGPTELESLFTEAWNESY